MGTLFQGHKYTFKKDGSDLVMLDSTDHSHENITFRKGIIVSGSSTPLLVNSRTIDGVKIVASNGATSDYLNLYQNDNWSYIYFANNASTTTGGGLVITEEGNDRIRIINRHDASSTYNYGMKFENTDFDHTSQEYGFYFVNFGLSPGATNYVAYFRNDGNSHKSRGILMAAGEDTIDSSGNTYFFRLNDGNGSGVSYVTCNSSGTVTWGGFTGAHFGKILQSDSPSAAIKETETFDEHGDSVHSHEYPTGTILVSVKAEITEGNDQPMHYFVTSSIFQDKRVLGVYGGDMNSNPKDVYVTDDDGTKKLSEKAEEPHRHQTYSLGDGVIIVSSQNGNIEVGDYITTASGSGGYGCKQNDDILHNYTVAKSLEDVDWSTESKSTKKIACTIHCG
jgi:hypothetical protein